MFAYDASSKWALHNTECFVGTTKSALCTFTKAVHFRATEASAGHLNSYTPSLRLLEKYPATQLSGIVL